MKKTFVRIVILFVLILSLLSFSGCHIIGQRSAARLAENIIERATAAPGEDVSVDLSSGKIKIKSDDEEIAIGSASLPDGWPREIPVPDNFNVITSWKSTVDGKSVFSVSGNYNGSLREALNGYRSQLSDDWNIENEFEGKSDGSKTHTITAVSKNYALAFFGTESEGEVVLVINVKTN